MQEIPQDAALRAHIAAVKRRNRIAANAAMFGFALSAILLLVGALVVVLVLELGESSPARDTLLYILAGSFAGGAILFALAAFLLGKHSERLKREENDYLERCDGEESFFVGDGTLATFGETALFLHGTSSSSRTVAVPYADLRIFSVCTRHAPREKGEWSVVFEIPVRYLSPKAKADEKPVLIQADAKERLSRAIGAHGLVLSGELPSGEENRKFEPLSKYRVPNRRKRKRAIFILAGAALLLAGGIVAAALWDVMIGCIAAVVGVLLAARGTAMFIRAYAVLALYREGVFWKESNPADRVFLKWQNVERVDVEEREGFPLLRFTCAYGAYHFPRLEGAYEAIREQVPEKCGGAE